MPPKRKRSQSMDKEEQVTKAKPKQGIFVFNDTEVEFISHSIERQTAPNSWTSTSLSLTPREPADASGYEGWTLYLQHWGCKLLCDGKVMPKVSHVGSENVGGALLEQGKEYRIVLDDACPVLNHEEAEKGFSLVVSCIEHGGRVPGLRGFPKLSDLCAKVVLTLHADVSTLDIPEELKDLLQTKKHLLEDPTKCWEWIAKQLGRSPEFASTVEKMVRHYGCRSYRLRWTGLYYPRRPQLLSLPNHNIILSALEKQQVGVVVYFRALNRFPGGNADMRVMKFKFFLPTCWPDDPAVDRDQCIVTFSSYANWDGDNSMSQRPEGKWKLPCETIQKNVMETLMKVLKEEGGGTDLETHVIEESEWDEDELDEWSSVEVLLHLPPWILPERVRSEIPDDVGVDSFPPPSAPSASVPLNKFRRIDDDTEEEPFWIPPPARGPTFEWPLVFRFHQRVLLPNIRSFHPEEDGNPDKKIKPRPTKGVKAELLKNIKSLFELGNVNETLECFNSAFKTVREPNRFEKQSFGSVYACPIFLFD